MGRVYEARYVEYAKGTDGKAVKDAHGKRVVLRDAGGKPVYKNAPDYYIEFTDAAGATVRRKGGVSKQEAKDALKRAESDALKERNDMPTVKIAELLTRGLVESYLASMGSYSAKHQFILKQRLDAVLSGIKAHRVIQITAESIERYLAQLESDSKLSPRSLNGYLQAVNGMMNWAVKNRRLPFNPLLSVVRRNEDKDKRREKDVLSEDEMHRLLKAALSGPTRRALRQKGNRPRKDGTFKEVELTPDEIARVEREGRRIAIIYSLMLFAGLRLNEVRSITWADVNFETGTLHLRAEWTKAGKSADIPLNDVLKTLLAAWRDENAPVASGGVVVRISNRVLKNFNDDLAAAGIEKHRNKKLLCLHALRHTFGTMLNRQGVDAKTMQMLMRHARVETTLNIYVHSEQQQLRNAVETLPKWKEIEAIPQSIRKASAGWNPRVYLTYAGGSVSRDASNLGLSAWEANALPLSYARKVL